MKKVMKRVITACLAFTVATAFLVLDALLKDFTPVRYQV